MGWGIDLLFKKNHETLTKDQCPSIFSCSSKERKSTKTSTSRGKTERLFYRTPPSGFLLLV